MAAIAKGLAGARAAATQPRGLHARHDTPGAADDLQVAAHLQRPVGQRVDGERAIAYRQHVGLASRRLPGRLKIHLMM
jgi:hypothetical protein